MDLEKALDKINSLESEIATLKKVLSSQTTKINNLEENVTGFLEKIRDQKKDVDRLSGAVSSLGQFDSALTQMRVDFTRTIEESEKRRVTSEKVQEKLRMDEVKALNQAIEKTRQEMTVDYDKKLKSHLDETARLLQKFAEIESTVEQNMRGDEEFKLNFNMFNQEFKQYKKRLENFSADVENYKKRQDEIREKQDVILNDLRTNDSRINEILATEAERKQSYITFSEQVTLTQRERDRIWKDWQTQFEDTTQQIYRLIPELQNQQIELNRAKSSFEEINQRFERRINEVTELYRLMDEKFRQEWATYKSDSDKKWSNLSLVFDEKQGGFAEQFTRMKERMLAVEDSTHEMQEALLLMSKEIQKGMQGLMNMVNGWMEAFGEIKKS